jgi:hypothetical protein
VQLEERGDQRLCLFEDDTKRLLSGLIYKASTQGDRDCPSYAFVWKNFAPPRVKFFGWLMTKERIHYRVALKRKGIVQKAVCELCKQADETADHIFSQCSFVQSFWVVIGWHPSNIASVRTFWDSTPRHGSTKNTSTHSSYAGKFGNTGMMSCSADYLPTPCASRLPAKTPCPTGPVVYQRWIPRC